MKGAGRSVPEAHIRRHRIRLETSQAHTGFVADVSVHRFAQQCPLGNGRGTEEATRAGRYVGSAIG